MRLQINREGMTLKAHAQSTPIHIHTHVYSPIKLSKRTSQRTRQRSSTSYSCWVVSMSMPLSVCIYECFTLVLACVCVRSHWKRSRLQNFIDSIERKQLAVCNIRKWTLVERVHEINISVYFVPSSFIYVRLFIHIKQRTITTTTTTTITTHHLQYKSLSHIHTHTHH